MSIQLLPNEAEEQGRILSSYEYVALLNRRPDIFEVEREKKLTILMPLMLLLAIALSAYITWFFDIASLNIDFAERLLKTQRVTLSTVEVSLESPVPVDPPHKAQPAQRQLEPQRANHSSKSVKKPGGGTPSASITTHGVIGILTGEIHSTTISNADIFAKGGYATDLDNVLAGMGGLKAGGNSGSGRRGEASLGYGDGDLPGFGGGSGGVDALDGLMGTSGAHVVLKPSRTKIVTTSVNLSSSQLSGGRSRSTIMRVVRQNLAALRYSFNKRLREKPGLKGKVTVQWAVDEFGNVLFAKVVSTTIDDEKFVQEILKKIKLWKFSKIDKPGDVTEVTYPFVFTQ